MSSQFTTAQLEGFLDESLPDHEMTALEAALRDDEALAQRLATLVGQRDAGVHTLGAIWRREFPTISTSSVMAIIRDAIGEAFHPRDCRTLEIV